MVEELLYRHIVSYFCKNELNPVLSYSIDYSINTKGGYFQRLLQVKQLRIIATLQWLLYFSTVIVSPVYLSSPTCTILLYMYYDTHIYIKYDTYIMIHVV